MILHLIASLFSPLFGLLQAVEPPPEDMLRLLQDFLALHTTLGYVLGGLVALLILVPLVLKALGKNVPLLDTGVSFLLGILKVFAKRKDPLPPSPEEQAKQPGVASVTELKDWPPEGK